VSTTISPNQRTYRFQAQTRTALLVTGEPWYPGWSAQTARGVASVHRAGFLTAVSVPAGADVVTMSYWPPGLTVGVVSSVLAIVGAVTVIVIDRRRHTVTAHRETAQR
jgi:uncharacterized membrane protein YfhO